VERYVIFDLDDTLVHSDAVRESFATVAGAAGIDNGTLTATLDALPGRPAREIFAALGLGGTAAERASRQFLELLDERNRLAPPTAYPDAAATLAELLEHGMQLILSTGSTTERAQRVLAQEGWDDFVVVVGCEGAYTTKGAAHYDRMAAEAPDGAWTLRAVTVGDSPIDMRLGAEHGVPVRIGIDRDGDPGPLLAAGATHVVRSLRDIVPIVTSLAPAA
jgi:phosphoglycolate phosphatase-like HAD superfamily hydrolase